MVADHEDPSEQRLGGVGVVGEILLAGGFGGGDVDRSEDVFRADSLACFAGHGEKFSSRRCG